MINEAYLGENLIYMNGETGATFVVRIAPGINSLTYQINGQPITETVKPGEVFHGFYRGRITKLDYFLDEDNGYLVTYRNKAYTEVIEFPFVPACTSYKGMFIGSYLTEVNALKDIVLSNVKDLSNMFQNCNDLKDISALKTWKVGNVDNIAGLFYRCYVLEDISALEDWDVSNIKDMSYMFNSCSILKDMSSISKWKVNADVSGMFSNCALTEADIRGWVMTTKVRNNESSGIFYGCRNLKSVNIDGTDISNIIDYAFYNCNALTDIIGTPKPITKSHYYIYLNHCPLTKDSVMKIINALPVISDSYTHRLQLNETTISALGEDISIATAKGWTVSA